MQKVTTKTLSDMKKKGERIAVLTAYDFMLASILDEIGIDIVLVGDSSGMVFSGYDTTLPVTMDEMLLHVKAVRRGVKRAMLVADMPFMSFQESEEKALYNAARFMKEGNTEAIKIEGGRRVAPLVDKMVGYGIPVMGHIGLTPQSIHIFGDWSVRGKTEDARNELLEDAKSLEEAGVFTIVLEKIPSSLAREITKRLKIPTIGIGAGPYCDGQVLVTYDMLGMFEKFRPKFVRVYAEIGSQIKKACSRYLDDVKSGRFPQEKESF
ncbi:MAG: 3-methyl-2-oxobutanoate hydroxymethyltransferase [Fidelibacterota bacterium]